MVYTVDSSEVLGLRVFDLSSEIDLDSLNDFDGTSSSSSRAAVCSGVAKQVADGQNLDEIKDCYSDYEDYIQEAYEFLDEEGMIDDPNIQDIFYATMLEIVEEALFG